MSKRIVGLFGLALVLAAFLMGCSKGQEAAKLVIDPANVEKVTVVLPNKKKTVVRDAKQVQELVDVLNSATATREESVQDTPTVAKYGKLVLKSKQKSRVLYYYQKSGKWYVEDPYNGIYQSKRNLNKLVE